MVVSHFLVDLCILLLLALAYKLTAARRQQDGRQRWRWWRWWRRAAAPEPSGERRAHDPTCPMSGSPNPAGTLSSVPLTSDTGDPCSEHVWICKFCEAQKEPVAHKGLGSAPGQGSAAKWPYTHLGQHLSSPSSSWTLQPQGNFVPQSRPRLPNWLIFRAEKRFRPARSPAVPPAPLGTGREDSGLPAWFPLTAPVGSGGDGVRDGSRDRAAEPVPRSKLQLKKEVRSKIEFHTARKCLQIKLKCLPGVVLCSTKELSRSPRKHQRTGTAAASRKKPGASAACPVRSSRARGRPVPVYFPSRESTFMPEEQREMLELHIRAMKLQRHEERLGRERPSQQAVLGQAGSRAAPETK